MKLFLFTVLALFGSVVLAQEVLPPETIDQALGFIPGIIEAAKNSNWVMFGAGVAMVLTWVIKEYVFPKIGLGNALLPWVSLVIGVLSGYGGAVFMGATPEAALLGLMSGPVASMLWAAVGQYFFPNINKA